MWEGIHISGFADEIAPELDKQLALLQKLDMHYVEMRGVNGRGLVQHSLSEAKEIKRQLDAAGVRLSSVGSPIGKIQISEDFEPHFELFKHTVELAHLMETPNIRMFSFFMPQGEDYTPYRSQVLEQLGRMVDYAAGQQVVLLHENEKEIYGDTAPRCLELMQHFYGAHFKAVFDFANFVQCRQDTLEAYELLKPYIAYVHIKDARRESGEVVPAGMGDGHLAEILGKLKSDGYQGFLSLEPHLSDFTGFSALENGKQAEKRKLSGEEAFSLAHQSLLEVLEQL